MSERCLVTYSVAKETRARSWAKRWAVVCRAYVVKRWVESEGSKSEKAVWTRKKVKRPERKKSGSHKASEGERFSKYEKCVGISSPDVFVVSEAQLAVTLQRPTLFERPSFPTRWGAEAGCSLFIVAIFGRVSLFHFTHVAYSE